MMSKRESNQTSWATSSKFVKVISCKVCKNIRSITLKINANRVCHACDMFLKLNLTHFESGPLGSYQCCVISCGKEQIEHELLKKKYMK